MEYNCFLMCLIKWNNLLGSYFKIIFYSFRHLIFWCRFSASSGSLCVGWNAALFLLSVTNQISVFLKNPSGLNAIIRG